MTRHKSYLILYIFYNIALQYLQIERVANRVRFVEEMYKRTNVFIYYKTLTIHPDNIMAIIL